MAYVLGVRELAHILYEANRALQAVCGDLVVNPPWEEVTEDVVDSIVNTIDAAMGGDLTVQDYHKIWVRWMLDHGWALGAEKNHSLKTHTALVSWPYLSSRQKLGEFIFMGIVEGYKKQLEVDNGC